MQKKERPFRPSSLAERKTYYKKEFSLNKVKAWFLINRIPLPQICALDAGTETRIIIDKKLKNSMLYCNFNELIEKIEQYLPEDIYYDRNTYAQPDDVINSLQFSHPLSQELVFDVDADNLSCKNHEYGSVCSECIEKAYHSTLILKSELSRKFKHIKIIYSGRGFHLHVLDKSAFILSNEERRQLTNQFSDFPIDTWVSGGRINLIRMPFSLNALVSRKALPLKDGHPFSPEMAIPDFLKSA